MLTSSKEPLFKTHIHDIFNCSIYEPSRTILMTSYTTTLDQNRIHQSILRLGMRMSQRLIVGTNERSKTLLMAIAQTLEDYYCPPFKSIDKHIKGVIDTQISFITMHRQHNYTMGNVIKWLKKQLQLVKTGYNVHLIITKLINNIISYIDRRIIMASETISSYVCNEYIKQNDNIVVYGKSTSVLGSLYKAAKSGKKFALTVIDSKNALEKEYQNLFEQLALFGIQIKFIMLNSLYHHIKFSKKILLGCSSIFSNGYILNKAGSALVALLAKSYNIQVIVMCESYKLSQKHYIKHSTNYNDIVETYINEKITVVSPCYDVIPPSIINSIVTEYGVHPAHSLALIVNEDNSIG